VDDTFEDAVKTWEANGAELAEETTLDSPTSCTSKRDMTEDDSGDDIEASPGMLVYAMSSGRSQFNPGVKTVGGRSKKPSPIQARRVKFLLGSPDNSNPELYNYAASSPIPAQKSKAKAPDLAHLESGPSGVVFRRSKRLKAGQSANNGSAKLLQQPSVLATTKAAPVHDNAAQRQEDDARRANNFDTWDDPQYQLRIEEANIICDLLTSLSTTLGLGVLAVADQGQNIQCMMSGLDWTKVTRREDVLVCVRTSVMTGSIDSVL
jgi:hypothetical protein